MKREILTITFVLLITTIYAQDGRIDTILDSFGNKHLNKTIQYPGDLNGLYKDISANFVLPKKAMQDKVHGQILLEFTVDTLGKVTKPKILKGLRPDVDSAVIKMCAKLKRFKPALMDDKKVPQKMNIPLDL